MFKLLTIIIYTILFLSSYSIAQDKLPILQSTTETISIRDGQILRSDYWTLVPEAKPDVYVADKSNQSKIISFISDIDSISFNLEPGTKHDFIVLLNGKDSCYTQIRSGIRALPELVDVNRKDTIPFRLTSHNNIVIEAILNQRDTLQLMLHTAASAVSLTREATQRLANLSFDDPQLVHSWGGIDSTGYADGNSLQIGAFTWEEMRVWESENSGPETDGKFGITLFDNRIIEFDFEASQLIIHTQLPNLSSDFEQKALAFNRNLMFLQGKGHTDSLQFENQFLIHSGYAGAVLFDDVFATSNQLAEQLEIISESSLSDSYGNILKTKNAVLPGLSIGNTDFKEIPVSFFEGAIARQKMSLIGGNLLKRFHLFLDLQQAYVYLKPNNLANLPFTDG